MHRKFATSLGLFVCLMTAAGLQVAAEPTTTPAEEGTVVDSEKEPDRAACYKESIRETIPAELDISGAVTLIVQGTGHANQESTPDDNGEVADMSYSVDVFITRKVSTAGQILLHLETGDGAGLSDEVKAYSQVNRDADDSDNSVSVTEAWYAHALPGINTTVMLGKIDPTVRVDTNAYANDECAQFMSNLFRNSPAIEFPDDNTSGIAVSMKPVEGMELDVALMDGDADWEDVGETLFLSGQMTLLPRFSGSEGHYRLYAWMNQKPHIQWSDGAETSAPAYGAGISVDQELTSGLGAFARYGWQNPAIHTAEAEFSLAQAWSAGVQISGTAWGREDDAFGVAAGQIVASDAYRKAGGLTAESEDHVEAYYRCQATDAFSITLDIQTLWDAYGRDTPSGGQPIVIGGLRTQADF